MNCLIKSFILVECDCYQSASTPFIFAVLFSATCTGNDGKQCSLFHGSVVPTLLSQHPRVISRHFSCDLLRNANCLGWTNAVTQMGAATVEILTALQKTRYSSVSLKTIQIDGPYHNDFDLLNNGFWKNLENLTINQPSELNFHFECNSNATSASVVAVGGGLLSLDLTPIQAVTVPLVLSSKFSNLRSFTAFHFSMNDNQFSNLRFLVNLVELKLISCFDLVGMTFSTVFPHLKEKLRLLHLSGPDLDIHELDCVGILENLTSLSFSVDEQQRMIVPRQNLGVLPSWKEFRFLEVLELHLRTPFMLGENVLCNFKAPYLKKMKLSLMNGAGDVRGMVNRLFKASAETLQHLEISCAHRCLLSREFQFIADEMSAIKFMHYVSHDGGEFGKLLKKQRPNLVITFGWNEEEIC